MTLSSARSLAYIRGFPNGPGDCAVHHLFDDVGCSGYLPQSNVLIEWDYPCEFICVQYDEPLPFVQARRKAFGGSLARFTSDAARVARRARIAACLESFDRLLVFGCPNQSMESYGYAFIRWNVPGVLEMPSFCIDSAMSDQARLQWGFSSTDLKLLRAASSLKPRQGDVFGFITEDERLMGAVEFTGTVIGELHEVHILTTGSRKLLAGDELWGWHTGQIGETRVEAKRMLATVEHNLDCLCPN